MKTLRIAGKSIPILPVRIWLPPVLIAVAAIGYFAIWGGWLRDHYYPKNWGVVERGKIYRSGMIECGLVKKALAENRIGFVLQMNEWDPTDRKQVALNDAVGELGIEIRRIPMSGSGIPRNGEIRYYADAIEAVCKARKAGKPVLIQCSAGANRTGGVVATYQLLVEDKDPPQVYRHLVDHKWNPDKPKLLHYMNNNMAELADLLAERGIIDRAPDPIPVLGPK